MKNKKFIPKIHLACVNDVLRPIFQYVLVTKENIVATNSHLIVKIPTIDIFHKIIDKLPERCLIHKDVWAQLVNADQIIDFKDDILFYLINGILFCLKVDYENSNTIDRMFPNYKVVMETKKAPVDKIKLRPDFLKKIQDCIFVNEKDKSLILEFAGNNGGISIRPSDPDNHAKAILMPMMITD